MSLLVTLKSFSTWPPAAVRDSELHFHFINFLPEQVSLQLKLQPKVNYAQTIAKARELRLIYSRAEAPQCLNQFQAILALVEDGFKS